MTMLPTREGWLIEAVAALRALFEEHGYEVPEARVSVGFPGGKNPLKTIGQCWPTALANDKTVQMFVSPMLENPVTVLAVLVHEMVHAVDDCKNEHKRPFSKIAKRLGLEGPWKATTAGPDLVERLDAISEQLGDYPHSALNPASLPGKQTTRMIKLVATECCEYTVRTSRKWIEEGLPACPHGSTMEEW